MNKKIIKNNIIIEWDNNNIEDMFSTINAVYVLEFPNRQVYIGSCENLADRIINHCTHKNTKREMTLNSVLRKYNYIKVYLVGTYQTIKIAKEIEKETIKKYSEKIYNVLKFQYDGDFKSVVNKGLLNAMLY